MCPFVFISGGLPTAALVAIIVICSLCLINIAAVLLYRLTRKKNKVDPDLSYRQGTPGVDQEDNMAAVEGREIAMEDLHQHSLPHPQPLRVRHSLKK